MSRVFIAEEVELRRKVVVKVLPPDMAAGLNAERFGCGASAGPTACPTSICGWLP